MMIGGSVPTRCEHCDRYCDGACPMSGEVTTVGDTKRTFTVLMREITTTAYYVEADDKDSAFEAYRAGDAFDQRSDGVEASELLGIDET